MTQAVFWVMAFLLFFFGFGRSGLVSSFGVRVEVRVIFASGLGSVGSKVLGQ